MILASDSQQGEYCKVDKTHLHHKGTVPLVNTPSRKAIEAQRLSSFCFTFLHVELNLCSELLVL